MLSRYIEIWQLVGEPESFPVERILGRVIGNRGVLCGLGLEKSDPHKAGQAL